MNPALQAPGGEFEGKIVLITGAAGLYGGQLARRFGELGCQLFLTDRNTEALFTLQGELNPLGRIEVCGADLTSAADLARLCGDVVERFGPPDVVINNAGIYPYGGLLDTPLETFDRIFDVNVRAGFEITRRLAGAMIAAGKAGSFLFLGSASAHVLRTNGLAYCASKRAIEWLMKGIALELGPYGIRVNMIEPGFWVGSALTTSRSGLHRRDGRADPAQPVAAGQRSRRRCRVPVVARCELHHRREPRSGWGRLDPTPSGGLTRRRRAAGPG